MATCVHLILDSLPFYPEDLESCTKNKNVEKGTVTPSELECLNQEKMLLRKKSYSGTLSILMSSLLF